MIDVLFNLASSNSTEELRWGRPEAEDPATSKKSRNEKSQNTADKCHAQTGLQVFNVQSGGLQLILMHVGRVLVEDT